jgi:PleD family two-component response regulator
LDAKQAFLEISELNKVDIVFIDTYMPRLSGFKVIRRLLKTIKTAVTTGNTYYKPMADEVNVSGYL